MLASSPALTVTELVAETEPTVALTVLTYVPALSPAVKRPFVLMVPPPFTTDHVGVSSIALPSASFTTAENCIVPAAGIEPLADETTIDAATGGAVTSL